MKERTVQGFGKRLKELRQSRGLTQIELGRRLDVSNRVIAYYEDDDAQPPGPMLLDLAKILRVSVDQLLGRAQVKDLTSPRTARLMNRLRRIEELSPAEQRIVLGTLDALLARRRGAGARKSG